MEELEEEVEESNKSEMPQESYLPHEEPIDFQLLIRNGIRLEYQGPELSENLIRKIVKATKEWYKRAGFKFLELGIRDYYSEPIGCTNCGSELHLINAYYEFEEEDVYGCMCVQPYTDPNIAGWCPRCNKVYQRKFVEFKK